MRITIPCTRGPEWINLWWTVVLSKTLPYSYVKERELLKASKQETLFKTNSKKREEHPLNRRKKLDIRTNKWPVTYKISKIKILSKNLIFINSIFPKKTALYEKIKLLKRDQSGSKWYRIVRRNPFCFFDLRSALSIGSYNVYDYVRSVKNNLHQGSPDFYILLQVKKSTASAVSLSSRRLLYQLLLVQKYPEKLLRW